MRSDFSALQIPVGLEFISCKLFKPLVIAKNITVITVHGWSSSDKKYIPLAQALSAKGYTVLTVNLRGHATKKSAMDKYTRRDHQTDIISAIQFMKDKYPNNKLVLLGKSYGGYLSSIVTNQAKVDALILSQPALYPDEDYDKGTKDLIKNNPNIFKQTNLTPYSNMALREFKIFAGPVLLIESENDKEVPKKTTQNYLNFSPRQVSHVVLKGADHALTEISWRKDFYKTVTEWLDKITKL